MISRNLFSGLLTLLHVPRVEYHSACVSQSLTLFLSVQMAISVWVSMCLVVSVYLILRVEVHLSGTESQFASLCPGDFILLGLNVSDGP